MPLYASQENAVNRELPPAVFYFLRRCARLNRVDVCASAVQFRGMDGELCAKHPGAVSPRAHQLRRMGSRKLDAYLDDVERVSGDPACPLTLPLLKHWLGEKVCELRYSPAFYVRLVHVLRPEILAQYRGPEPAVRAAKRSAKRSLTRTNTNSYSARNMNSPLTSLSVQQLKQAVAIREQIESLEHELNSLLGSSSATPAPGARRGRRKVSAAGRARMAAAQKARWAKIRGNGAGATDKKPRRKMSAAGRAMIAAAAKARWKKAKAAGRNKL